MNDCNRSFIWRHNPHYISGVVSHNLPDSIEDEYNWLSRINSQSDRLNFAICLSDNTHIGNIYITNIDFILSSCESSIFLGSPEHLGKGYSKKAMQILLNICKEILKLKYIYAKIKNTNDRSISLHRSLGYNSDFNFDMYSKLIGAEGILILSRSLE